MKTAFLFGAQGSQWAGMGCDLLRDEPAFASAIADCEPEIRRRGGWSLTAELSAAPGAYRAHDNVRLVQPTLTALQISLVRLLRSVGVEADGAAALSMGEAAAAWCCGAIDLSEAMEVAWRTALLTEEEAPQGLMAYLQVNWGRAGELVNPWRDRVALAVELGAEMSVISGEISAVEEVLRDAEAKGVRGGRLPLVQAYHSPIVQGIGGRFREGLRGLRPQPTRIPLYSSATGGIQRGEALTPEHWWIICSGPSYFYTLARRMIQDGFRRFVEVSPKPMLAGTIRDVARQMGANATVVSLMDERRGGAGWLDLVGADALGGP